ncbi:hypothetical protein QW131_22535 [Roseibium salinum]|nr:hypothetical protein [Roseibium salinum]
MTLSNKLEDEAQAGLLADAARTFFCRGNRPSAALRQLRPLCRAGSRRPV